jgi:hypothetical protein
MTAFSGSRDAAGLRDCNKLLEIAKIKVQGASLGDRLLYRTSRTRVDAHYGQTFGLPLRDAARQVSGWLPKRHALARRRK